MAVGESDFSGTARFEIVRRLGAGGMGVVYEARDREQDRRVALKTVLSLRGDDLRRLRAEFGALQGLRHPNLCSLYELHEDGERCFFTMELVEGESFVRWVRPGAGAGRGALDAGRLRAALGQLGRGLLALHEAGRVHRDIKPANVLVTPAGRVVLLDFGLAAILAPGPDQSLSGQTVGTVEYMAPEQAAAAHVGPEADWYGVGVVLYEALTGELPFNGAPLEIMARKQQVDPPPPHALWPEVPPDLDALCVELLRFDPAARPRGRRLLARLGEDAPGGGDDLSSTSSHAEAFVGRARELAALRQAFAAARRGVAVTVLVHGESGVGKTTLCRRFAADVAAGEEPAVVLRGRLHERLPHPYRVLEGVMDALGHHLARLSPAAAASLLPEQVGLVGEVFPALRRAKAVAEAPRAAADSGADPQERRTRMFAAARALFGRVARAAPLVLVIDDLQWADPDGLALLAELLRPPDAPPLLLVATLRAGTEFVGSWGAPEVGPYLPGEVRRLRVDPLDEAEGRELASLLAGRFRATGLDAGEVAAESRGLPLLVEELVRLGAAQGQVPTSLRPEEVIRARASRLPSPARRVLEVLALAGAPLPIDAVARAAGVEPADLQRWLGRLRVGGFATFTGVRGADLVAVAHERTREAMLGCLEQEARVIGERELALALEASGRTRPECLAVHWRGAGDRVRAATHAAAAAERASAAFAFDHAALHYRMALDLGVPPPPRELRIRLGDTLALAGRGAEAAEAYLEAAAGAPPFEALDLRSRAAAQYLRAGAIEPGLEEARGLAATLGVPMASTPDRALGALLLRRALVRLRGLGHRRREEREIAAERLARLDAAFALSASLSTVDTIRTTDLNARILLRALRLGEPRRLARALATEAGFTALLGPRAAGRTEQLLRRAEELAHGHDDPVVRVYIESSRGMADYYAGRFAGAWARLQAAEAVLRERCAGRSWELGLVLLFSQFALYYCGRIAEMSRRVPLLAAEAADRGDLYTATNLRLSLLNSAWLAPGDAAAARRMALEASGRWGRERFTTQHWFDLMAQAQLALYEGDGDAAEALVGEQWEALQHSLLPRIQLVRIESLHLRARCALGAAQPARRAELLERARRDAELIRRERSAWGDPLADLALAGATAATGDDARARELLAAATRGFEAQGMALHAAVARRRHGALLGGDEGRALAAAADEWLRGQQIAAPARWTAMIAPWPGEGEGGRE